ncbi:hypothetical protein IY145_16215 [Methylosinus sp. H3A]|uniref:hypothetical protein n=1 Tax=Methylosinus sp. H3A TaxID=2785786 RepID=UPI0018C2CDE5|nr:hypothetical protein [Methylosinus sp. H3A]MBG0810915.1 hypothetical protein [Methylosinus sp. H3A]
MARIVFVVWPMPASVLAGLKIARGLRARGHDVSYIGPASSRKFIEPHGFPFTPVYVGWLPEEPAADETKDWSVQKRREEARARSRASVALLEALASDRDRELQDILERARPDLLIIHSSDFEVIIPSLLAFEAGVVSVYLCSTFARAEARSAR